MKQKFLPIVLLGFSASMLMSGCATQMAQSYSYSEYRTIDPTQQVNTAPLVADLVVAEKRITYAERLIRKVNTMTDSEVATFADREKQVVIANAIKTNNADVLVAPIIDIQTDENGYIVISVTGYPASYKNFHNAKKDESWFLQVAKPEEKKTETKEEGGSSPLPMPLKLKK